MRKRNNMRVGHIVSTKRHSSLKQRAVQSLQSANTDLEIVNQDGNVSEMLVEYSEILGNS